MNYLLGSDEIYKVAQPLLVAARLAFPRFRALGSVEALISTETRDYECPEGAPNWIDALIFGSRAAPLWTFTYGERKRFSVAPCIMLFDYLLLVEFLYETGAVLGRARKDRVSLLVRMLDSRGKHGSPSIDEDSVIKSANETASIRLNEYKAHEGREPLSFGELIDYSVRKVRGTSYNIKILVKKVLVNKVFDYLRAIVLEGVGFGCSFPELTAQMYRNHYENIDMVAWEKAKRERTNIPDEPTIISLESVEEALLIEVGVVTEDLYPELLEPLDLVTYSQEYRSRDLTPEELVSKWEEIFPNTYRRWFEMFQCLIGSRP